MQQYSGRVREVCKFSKERHQCDLETASSARKIFLKNLTWAKETSDGGKPGNGETDRPGDREIMQSFFICSFSRFL